MGIWYRAGTASVENGSNVVTGTLTVWGASVQPGNAISFDGGSKWYEIAALDATTPNTKLTLVDNFAETAITNGAYAIQTFAVERTPLAIRMIANQERLIASQTDVIETTGAPDPTISPGNISGKSIAFDNAAKAYYRKTDDGTWDGPISLIGPDGQSFAPDARGAFTGRTAHDAEAAGYCYLSIDGDGDTITTAVLFFKNSATSGDWSSATPLGAKGDKGDAGDAATVTVGSVTTLDPGDDATVSNSGTSSAAVFDFSIPQGETGPANVLSIGTVTTGDAGSDAAADITGTAPTQTLNLTIPRGDKGDTGRNFAPDAVGNFSGRSAHDAEAADYCYLSNDGDGDTISDPVLFFKNSATSGDWSDPVPFEASGGVSSYNDLTDKPTLGTAAALDVDADGTLAANSDSVIATQKAVRAYADALIAANDAMVFKGVIDCSANPNYPAANRGETYRVSVAGKIGGASGINVEAGDLLLCLTDSTSSGNQATVGSAWTVAQTNLDGAVIGPASVTDGNFAQFDGTTGKLIKGGKAAPSGTVLGSDSLDTDGTLAANDDTKIATQKAVKTYVDNHSPTSSGPTVQVFTSSGTWIKPAGCLKIKVTVVGGAGAGGGAQGGSSQASMGIGGGAGGHTIDWIDATSLTTESVTVGLGGAGISGTGAANAGGTSSFGSLLSATGGSAGSGLGSGTTVSYNTPAAGGFGSGGTINGGGIPGLASYRASGTLAIGGAGAQSIFPGGGTPRSSQGDGSPGAGPGTGGGGAVSYNSTQQKGGDGANGIVIVEEYYA